MKRVTPERYKQLINIIEQVSSFSVIFRNRRIDFPHLFETCDYEKDGHSNESGWWLGKEHGK